MATLTQAKRRRETYRASITRLERDIDALESKPVLTASNHQMAVHLLKRLDGWCNAAFKNQHFIILGLPEGNGAALDGQQRELDYHEDKISNFAFRLEQLAHPSAPTPPTGAPVLMTENDEVALHVAADSSRGLTK